MKHLYDTHFHLDLQKERDNALEEINRNHIYTIAVTNLPDLYKKEKELYETPYLRLALGFHPELVHEYKHQIPLMWELLPQARYIGEVGLDFLTTKNDQTQIAFFEELVSNCYNDSNKILTIHSRKALSVVLDIIGIDFSFRPILHWFNGSIKELDIAIERGYYFSINPSMIKSSRCIDIISHIPRNKLLLETDSPFTSSMRQKDALAQIVSTLDNEDSGFLWENFKSLLGLS